MGGRTVSIGLDCDLVLSFVEHPHVWRDPDLFTVDEDGGAVHVRLDAEPPAPGRRDQLEIHGHVPTSHDGDFTAPSAVALEPNLDGVHAAGEEDR